MVRTPDQRVRTDSGDSTLIPAPIYRSPKVSDFDLKQIVQWMRSQRS